MAPQRILPDDPHSLWVVFAYRPTLEIGTTVTPRFYAPKTPRQYFYMLRTPDYDGVTIGHTTDPVWRFTNYEFEHGYQLIGVWVFPTADKAQQFEETVKQWIRDGILHGVVIPHPGRWTESMTELSAQALVRNMERVDDLVRVSWPDSGPFHDVTAENFELHTGRRWERHVS